MRRFAAHRGDIAEDAADSLVADLFGRRCKNIQIKFTSLDSMAMIDALDAMVREDPTSLPTLWSPTDSLAVEYLKARWDTRSSGAR